MKNISASRNRAKYSPNFNRITGKVQDRFTKRSIVSRNRHERKLVRTIKTDEFTVNLFNTNSALVMINKDESYQEHIKTSGQAEGMSPVMNGVSRLLNITEAGSLFEDDDKLILKLLSALKEYIDFIGWDKTRDGEGLKLTLNCFKKETMEYIFNLNLPLKDVWVIFTSLSAYHYSPHIDPEAIETILNKTAKEDFEKLSTGDVARLKFVSSVSYLLPSFPVALEKDAVKSSSWVVNLLNSTGHESTVADFIDSNVVPARLNTVDTRNVKALRGFKDGADFKPSKKPRFPYDDSLEDTPAKPLNQEDLKSLTKEEFIQYFAVSSVLYSNFEKRTHFERVKEGLKFNYATSSLSDNNLHLLHIRLTDEEIARAAQVKQSSEYLHLKLLEPFIFESFTKNPEVFENFANDFDAAVDAFIDLSRTRDEDDYYSPTPSATNFLSLLKTNKHYRKVYDDYMNDPEMSFDMMLRIEDVVKEDDYLIRPNRSNYCRR